MIKFPFRIALVVVVALLASPTVGSARAQYVRRNAITEAVAKTRMGIVTLKVTKDNGYDTRSVAGSGFIVDERGYAITNHHVIADALRIVVTLGDKTKVEATVHKALPRYDLAILKLDTNRKLKALQLAPAGDLMQGETVIAIGNPHGYAGTVSTGIISALGREINMPAGATLVGLIQHSASINPGNSGGPLLNINGELIGVNVALREGAQSISFAINSDTVKAALSKHLSLAKVSKVSHGLDCSEKIVAEQGDRQHLIVRKAAAGAEVKTGDVIVAVGTMTLQNRFDLERSMWGHKAGETIRATVLRAGKKTQVSITLSGTQTRPLSTPTEPVQTQE
jgi:serine protease Do